MISSVVGVGACCFLRNKDEKLTVSNKPCPYLIRYSSGRTHCRIYHNRLGKKLPNGNVCVLRKYDIYRFKGCPYNDLLKDKPMWEE